jgi:hypothetical protein
VKAFSLATRAARNAPAAGQDVRVHPTPRARLQPPGTRHNAGILCVRYCWARVRQHRARSPDQFSRTGNMVARHSRASPRATADTPVVLHYHGGRHSTWQVAVEIWRRRHALVSFADSKQIVIAAEVAQSFGLDNGAFSVWKQGIQADWLAYYKWVEEWRRHPGFDWAIIPDVIEGDEAANDALLAAWPFAKTAGLPVWHFHESLERLARLAGEWQRVALGSSGQYATVGTPRWWGRMQRIMETICEGGKPKVKLHGLRMLRPAICRYLPLASADSAGVSRSIGTTNWGGCYRQASDTVKAQVLVESYESAQAAAVWAGIPSQEELFG